MNEETSEVTAPVRKKRKPAKKRAAAPKPPAVKSDGVYAGLTVHDCCTACGEKGCVISGQPYCGHPRKGGLHAREQQDDAAMKRRRDAEKVLGKQKLIVE